MRYKILAIALLLSIAGCKQFTKDPNDSTPSRNLADGHLQLTPEELQQLGVLIADGKVMYNNITEGAGSLNIAIRDREYFGEGATTFQTRLNYYPRYITTVDTLQRVMYALRGSYPELELEVLRWQQFENLVPVIVQQSDSNGTFGETLLFWFTRTNELEHDLEGMSIEFN